MLRGVIVDLDGTLIQSRKMHEFALNDALLRNGFQKLKEWVYGPTTENLIRYNFPNIHIEELNKISEMKKRTVANYLNLVEIVPGAEELLNFLKVKKIKVCLLTNNTHAEIVALLNHLKWNNKFDEIVGKVREKAGLSSSDFGTKLMSKAFKKDGGFLIHPLIENQEEQEGIHFLMRGAISYFKNPSSHRWIKWEDPNKVIKVLMFIDFILDLVDECRLREQGP